MDNIELKLIDEMQEQTESFVIDNDDKAEWALSKIAAEKADCGRLISVCEYKIRQYQSKISLYNAAYENSKTFLQGKLEQYFATVPHGKSKTQETYKLPSGTLKLKIQAPDFVRDEEKLVAWLKQSGKAELIETKETPKWGELKKTVTVLGDKVVTADGGVVDGVTAKERQPVFEVDI